MYANVEDFNNCHVSHAGKTERENIIRVINITEITLFFAILKVRVCNGE